MKKTFVVYDYDFLATLPHVKIFDAAADRIRSQVQSIFEGTVLYLLPCHFILGQPLIHKRASFLSVSTISLPAIVQNLAFRRYDTAIEKTESDFEFLNLIMLFAT